MKLPYYTPPRGNHDRRLLPAPAGQFIRHAADEIHPGDRVFLICRVSGHVQEWNRNLQDAEDNLRDRARMLGAIVVEVEKFVSGEYWPSSDPIWLHPIAIRAKEQNAKLFAESTDRFIRSPDYHSRENPDAQARITDLEDLARWTDGVTLVTDLHPDASPWQVRSYQRRRGQKYKDNFGGRPRDLMRACWKLFKKLPDTSGGKGSTNQTIIPAGV